MTSTRSERVGVNAFHLHHRMKRAAGADPGFAFVEMPNEDEAKRAIEALHDKEFMTRNLMVNMARPMEKKF